MNFLKLTLILIVIFQLLEYFPICFYEMTYFVAMFLWTITHEDIVFKIFLLENLECIQ